MEYKNDSISNSSKTLEDRSSGSLVNIGPNFFFLIAGGNREKTFNDFWYLKVVQKDDKKYETIWQEIKLNQNFNFQARFGMAAVKINNKTNENDDKIIYLHGGQNYFEGKFYADMILILIQVSTTKQPEILKIQNYTEYPLNILNTPKERNSHSIVNFSEKGLLFMFGGGSHEGLFNDLWKFNTNTNKWTECVLKGEQISSREMHGMISYTNKKKEEYLYIFGGRLYEGIDDKIYRINIETCECELLGQIPISLCSFSCASFKHFIILYGGTDGVTFNNDIIIYNITNKKWARSKFLVNAELVNSDQNLMPFLGRIGSMMSLDEISEIMVIFGGSSLHKDTNYTFALSMKDLLDENNLISFSSN